MLTSHELLVPYVEMPCFLEESRSALKTLSPFKPFEDGAPFAYHLSYHHSEDRDNSFGTSNLLIGTFNSNSLCWMNPAAFRGSLAGDLSIGMMRLTDDWRIDDVMLNWLPDAITPLNVRGEVNALCFAGGILIENGDSWPIKEQVSHKGLQSTLDRFALLLVHEDQSAHDQIKFLSNVQAYIQFQLLKSRPYANDDEKAVIHNLVIRPKDTPYGLR
jgi:hypothetical protein